MKFNKINEELTVSSHAQFLEMQKGFDTYQYKDLLIEAWPTVYHPGTQSSTLFMLRHLPRIRNLTVLEIGCGSGLIGISLAGKNKVFLSDINPTAVECSEYNALVNKVEVQVFESDLFDKFQGQKFDVILFNTPYWHRELQDEIELLACDPNGEIFTKFIKESQHYLKDDGYVIFTYSNLSNEDTFHNTLKDTNFTHEVIGQEQDEPTNIVRWLVKIQLK